MTLCCSKRSISITSRNNVTVIFICLNCLRSFATEKKLESHKRLCGNEKFCNIVMSSEDTTILEFNQYQKSDKIIIYY